MASAEFSKFADILSAALSQQTERNSLTKNWAMFIYNALGKIDNKLANQYKAEYLKNLQDERKLQIEGINLNYNERVF